MSKFKPGDKALYYGDKVEICGEMIEWSDKEKRYSFKYEGGAFDFGFEDCLKAIIDNELNKGQEVWVKMKFNSMTDSGNIELKYRDFEGDSIYINVSPRHELLIKNAEGQIVPYNIHKGD